MALSHPSPSFSVFGTPTLRQQTSVGFSPLAVCCLPKQPTPSGDEIGQKKRLSEQSSWEAKDSEGRDYLYRLGKEADNMNIAVGARSGVVDDLFAGNFLGRDCNSQVLFDLFLFLFFSFKFICFASLHIKFGVLAADIVFDYRQKVTRSFDYLQGDYYIAPVFMVHCCFHFLSLSDCFL